jgi:sortase (surface protein transpeptidase)
MKFTNLSSKFVSFAIFLVLGVVGAVGPADVHAQEQTAERALQAASTTDQAVLSPQFLVIPKISEATAIESVGRNADGQMKTPSNWRNTGWYRLGVKPGQNGHAVLAAHRDWDGNAGPFYQLPELSVGDNVFIAGKEAIHIYSVTKSSAYGRRADPASAIFERNKTPMITLISCEGDYVDAAGTYDERRVVQAKLTHTFQ